MPAQPFCPAWAVVAEDLDSAVAVAEADAAAVVAADAVDAVVAVVGTADNARDYWNENES